MGSFLAPWKDVGAGLVRSLRHNLGLGLLALGLSATLWVFISTEQNPPKTEVFPQELRGKAVNVSSGLHVFGEVPSVTVRATAPRDVWNGLDASNFEISLDLSEATQGVHEIKPRVSSRDSRVRVVGVEPSTVKVRLEPAKSKVVPVKLKLKGAVPFGYSVGTAVLAVEHAAVQGPEPLVDQVDTLVAELDLEGQKVDVNQSFPLLPQTGQGYEVSGVTVEPPKVGVRLPITQQILYRTLPVNPMVRGSVAPGYAIEHIATEPSTAILVGSREAVELVANLTTEPISVDGATESIVRVLNLNVPKGANIAGEPRVVVRIRINPILGSRTLAIGPTFEGLAPDKTLVAEVDSLLITLSGPLPLLQNLGPPQVQASLDLANFGPGVYVLTPKLSVPEGVTVLRMTPEKLRVMIK